MRGRPGREAFGAPAGAQRPWAGFYDAKWRLRALDFLAQHPLCGMRAGGASPVMSRCFEQGVSTPASHADHVVAHRGNRRLFDDPLNLQALCEACHAKKTNWEYRAERAGRHTRLRRF